MFRSLREIVLCAGILLFLGGTSIAADYALSIVPEKKVLSQGEEFGVEAVLKADKAGVQGWSFGIRHDPNLLEILSVTTEGTDTPTLFNGGFLQTVISTENNVKVGWTQGVILSWSEPDTYVVPVTPKFVMAKARYRVKTGICGTQSEVPATLTYVSDLVAAPGSPPLDLVVTVAGKGAEFTTEGANLSLQCPTVDLQLIAQAESNRKLIADKTDVFAVDFALKNNSTAAMETQGWSYGFQIDPAVLSIVGVTYGPAVAALHGNLGPDFHSFNYDPILSSADGNVKGGTIGVVISLTPPQEDVLPFAAGETKVLEVLKVKSAMTIAAGQPDVTTPIGFVSEVLPGDRPIENIIVVNGISVAPSTQPLTVTLTAPGVVRNFKRGEVNGDGRFDIADAVKIVDVIFRHKDIFLCEQAADVNDDGLINAADIVWIIDYEFRGSGKPPAEPFSSCGSDPTGHALSCSQPTGNC